MNKQEKYSKFIGWLIPTLITLVAAYYGWKSYTTTYENNPEISVSETLRYEIESTDNFAGVKLDYHLNDKKIDRVIISTYKIVNQGSTSIEAKDFFQPLSATPVQRGKIFSASVLSTNPPSLNTNLKLTTGSTWQILPTLLNPGDEINIAFITQPEMTPKTSESKPSAPIEWNARVKGMKDLHRQTYEDVSALQTIIFTEKATTALEQFRNGWTIALTPTSLLPFILLAFILWQLLTVIDCKTVLTGKYQIMNQGKHFVLFLVSISASEVAIYYLFDSPNKLIGAHFVNSAVGTAYIVIAFLLAFKNKMQGESPNQSKQ